MIKQIFDKYRFQVPSNYDNTGKSANYDWDLHITCKNDYTDQKIHHLKITSKDQLIMGISGRWTLGSKILLWHQLVSYYGRAVARSLMPTSYLLDKPGDKKLLSIEYNKQKNKKNQKNKKQNHRKIKYFKKKDIERQEGIEFFDDLSKQSLTGYQLVQECLDNPLLYQQHKINIRCYILYCCGQFESQAYLFHDGLVSYAEEPYDEHKFNNKNMIASFYKSGKLYDRGYPILWSDLVGSHLGWSKNQRERVWKRIKDLLHKVLKASYCKMCRYKFRKNNKSFELFGADIFLDADTLQPKLLEINVKPGMDPHDARDKSMRERIYEAMFSRMKLIKLGNQAYDFELFWEK